LLKKGDDDGDEVDNDVRNTLPQNHATATQTTEESFLYSVFIVLPSYQQRCGGGTENRQSMQYLETVQPGSQLPARPPYS
jgi:hypothetical protein